MFGRSFNIIHIVTEYCEKVCNDSRMVAVQFSLDLTDIRDNFRHSVSMLSFNKFCKIIVHLAMQQLI